MIPALYTNAAAAALVVGALAFGAAWQVQGMRYGLQIEHLKHQATQRDLDTTTQAVQDMAAFQKGLNNALDAFQDTQQRNAAAQKDLDRLLLDLRGTTAGLRSDFAGLPQRIATAAQPALAEYASACTAVFQELADRGGRMAERGAEIAAAADGHAADAGLMRNARPVKSSQPAP